MNIRKYNDDIFSFDQLVVSLSFLGDQLPDPLRFRVDVCDYAKKLKENGVVYFLLKNDDIHGIMAFYANDKIEKKPIFQFCHYFLLLV